MEKGLKAPTSVSLADAIQAFLDHLRATGKRDITIVDARYRIAALVGIVGGDDPLLEDVQKRHVEARLSAHKAVAGKRGTLFRMNAFFEWSIKQGFISKNPARGVVAEGFAEQGKRTLTRVEATRLSRTLAVAIRQAEDNEAALAVLLLLYCGLRSRELLCLQVRDLDLDSEQPVLSVERHGKTRRSIRDVELTPELATLLRARIKGRKLNDWLWPTPHSRSGHRGKTWLLKRTKAFCKAAGIEKVCPQGLRGTHARTAREAGVTAHVIRDQLGHEHMSTTVKAYIGQEVEDRERSRTALKVIKGGEDSS